MYESGYPLSQISTRQDTAPDLDHGSRKIATKDVSRPFVE
jgi:hypothetical protein